MEPRDGVVGLHLFVDRSSVEVFGNGGRVVLTDLVFPTAASAGLELFVEGGEVVVHKLEIYRLNPATFMN
jgi:fructan beta-fructosidase